jgi:hypothetical protein
MLSQNVSPVAAELSGGTPGQRPFPPAAAENGPVSTDITGGPRDQADLNVIANRQRVSSSCRMTSFLLLPPTLPGSVSHDGQLLGRHPARFSANG